MKDNKDIWLVKRGERFTRYKLLRWECIKLYNNTNYNYAFPILKYYGEGDTWELCYGGDKPTYVDVVTLMSEFMVLGSDNYNYVTGLETLRDNNFKVACEANISGITSAVEELQSPENNEPDVATNMGEQLNEDERHQKDFCTLHSGELEANEERPIK